MELLPSSSWWDAAVVVAADATTAAAVAAAFASASVFCFFDPSVVVVVEFVAIKIARLFFWVADFAVDEFPPKNPKLKFNSYYYFKFFCLKCCGRVGGELTVMHPFRKKGTVRPSYIKIALVASQVFCHQFCHSLFFILYCLENNNNGNQQQRIRTLKKNKRKISFCCIRYLKTLSRPVVGFAIYAPVKRPLWCCRDLFSARQ
jgi:hypothetical protein